MKRALAMGLGALLAAGSAAPLSAASQIDFSGYYRVFFASETNLGHLADPESFTDGYFGNRLEFNIDFKPTDELTIFTRLRLPDFRRWGSGNSATNTGSGFQTRHIYGQITQDWGQILVGRLDEDLDNFGLATLGWIPENNPVFTTVSPFDDGDMRDAIRYANQWDNGFSIAAQYTKVNNNTDEPEGGGNPGGVMSDEDFDRFAVEAAYQWDGGGVSLGLRYDRDATDARPQWRMIEDGDPLPDDLGNATSAWYINPAIRHGWENGFSVNFEALLGWGRTDRARLVFNNGDVLDVDSEGYAAYLDFDYNYGPGNVNLAGWYASGTGLEGNDTFDYGSKNKSLISMGGNFIPLLVAYNDGALGQGRVGVPDGNGNAVSVANNAYFNFLEPNLAVAGVGLYIDDVWGPGNGANAYAAYVADGGGFLNWVGDDIIGLGNGNDAITAPTVDLLVNPVHMVEGGGGNSNLAMISFQRGISFDNGTEANHWAIAISGNHAFTDDIAMHYAVAYLGLNKPTYRVTQSALWNTDGADQYSFTNYGYIEQDKDLGFEVDFGLSFQLLDNLELTTAFGYMFNGDAFKTLKGYTLDHNDNGNNQHAVTAVWEDPDDTYTWLNTLTFSF